MPALPGNLGNLEGSTPSAHNKRPSATGIGARVMRSRGFRNTIVGLGEGMLTLGILIGLLVVWMLWWTDLGANRQQREILDDLGWGTSIFPVPLATPPVSPGGVEGPVYAVIPQDQRHDAEDPPLEPDPAYAETFAVMYVPAWGYDYARPISEGISRRDVLDVRGIGHYPRTALPGEWGNFSVAAHRTTFGKPFHRIEELEVGDVIVIRTEGTWYVYRVTETHIVSPTDVSVIAPQPHDRSALPDGRYITLTTCHPMYSATKRYIVHGELEYWATAEAGYPRELVPPGSTMVDASLPQRTEGA